MAEKTLELILRKPWLVLAVICVATVPSLWVIGNARFSSSIVASFVDDRQDYLDALELERVFVGNPDALLWLATHEDGDLFTPEKMSSIRSAAEDIESLPWVKRVVALPDLEQPGSQQYGVRSTTQRIVLNAKLKQGQVPNQSARGVPIFRSSSSPADLTDVRRRVMESDGYARRFIAAGGTAQLMLIELNNPYDIGPKDQIQLVDRLLSIVSIHGLGQQATYLSGLVALQAYAYGQIGLVLQFFLPLGGVLISLAVMFVFRRFAVVLVTLLIATVSNLWGIGLGLFVYGDMSVLMAAVPLMVLVISTADVIHLVSSYTAERQAGVHHHRALHKMFREVGGACVLTSVTTFVGFASLTVVPSNTIRQFGFSAAAGVASALILSVVIVPLFLHWLAERDRPVVSTASASFLLRLIANQCLRLAGWAPMAVIVCFLVLFALAGFLASGLSLDPDLTQRFTDEHPVSRSTHFFKQHLGGINSVEIILRGAPEDLLSPDNVQRLSQFARRCERQTGVTEVESPATLITGFLQRLDYRNSSGLPESTRHARAALNFVRQSRPQIVDALVTRDHRQMRVLVRIQQTSYMEMLKVSTAIAQEARQQFDASVEVIEKGSAPLIGRAVGEIIRGHLQGFLICFSAIFVLITFGLKSLKLGCLSVLPNLTPLLFLGGIIGLTSTTADSDILAVATLGLGLAVDDTIHFLSRFQIELSSGKSIQQSVQAAMDHTGLAIIRTTLILSIGFAPFAFSGYWSINMLGTYLLVVLATALLADLVFLPAILLWAYRRHKTSG